MSKVFLIPNHHCLENQKRRLEFIEEMLSWPIRRSNNIKDVLEREIQKLVDFTYPNVLKALMTMGKFDSIFCLQVDREKQILYFAYRTWGWILLNNEIVAGFSHDTRYTNQPFDNLFEWPELEDCEMCAVWTVDEWKTFFYERIKKITESRLAKAKLTAEKANQELAQEKKHTDKIMIALITNI